MTSQITQNSTAFLDMLARSEGTEGIGSNHGYDVIVGSTVARPILLEDYKDHPRVLVQINDKLKSDAAGRYQFISSTWDDLVRRFQIPDFTSTSQDFGALKLIGQVGALGLVQVGRIEEAIHKCRKIWASLPGAGYGQHENSLAKLLQIYQTAGGSMA
jgi:muramidase (phage lysozyme)